jgi:hypothetical protein
MLYHWTTAASTILHPLLTVKILNTKSGTKVLEESKKKKKTTEIQKLQHQYCYEYHIKVYFLDSWFKHGTFQPPTWVFGTLGQRVQTNCHSYSETTDHSRPKWFRGLGFVLRHVSRFLWSQIHQQMQQIPLIVVLSPNPVNSSSRFCFIKPLTVSLELLSSYAFLKK